MGNKERIWYPNTIYHITIRGNRRNDIFRDEEDFEVYLTQLEGNIEYYNNEYEILLNDILSNLGMGIAFTESADFTKINPIEQLFISKVKHKTFVDVNEEGTEAAAVTVVEIQLTSAPVSTTMKVDRPFIFVIRETNSRTMLFMGKIIEPSL